MELLFLLLPVAAFTGWILGRNHKSKSNSTDYSDISVDYLRGIRYLLNEQEDKALDIFVKMVEENSEVVEIHLALGNLFRKQGEVERSIRIHQNLIARPTLNKEHREQALFELAQDYMKAGLLDRAEKLFVDAMNNKHFSSMALSNLLIIYQQEKEWQKAINIAEKLAYMGDKNYNTMQSHFYCELAHEDILKKDLKSATYRIQKALYADKKNVRASIQEGDLALSEMRYKPALKAYKRIEVQDPVYLGEVISKIHDCYHALGRQADFLEYVSTIDKKYKINLSSAVRHIRNI
ncbi:MAG: lipopolysaccharide assembly protein LapB, partial [Gammaproteobacteria bacterium]|nr:lipopolysaccharide assembly protein LapB [Gammaproteobacteria bacterium]